jgi:hypothetical protein
MNAFNIVRGGALVAVVGIVSLAAGTTSAHAEQNFGRSSVYVGARSTTAPRPFDGVTVIGNGRGGVYAVASRATSTSARISSRARTLPGNGRGSVYARTNDSARG